MTRNTPRHLNVMLVSLLVLAAFLVGHQSRNVSLAAQPVWAALTSQSLVPTIDTTASLRPIQLYQEAISKVQREYVDKLPSTDAMTYAAIRGMLTELHDPYTRFMDPKEFTEFTSDNQGHFAGVGIILNMAEVEATDTHTNAGTFAPVKCPVCQTVVTDTKYFRVAVVEPLPNTPAAQAGIQPGDFIMKIGDKSTDGMTIDKAADLMRGPVGTKVTISVARKGIDKPIEVTITRAVIEVPAVEAKVLDGKIGYLRIYQFNEKTVDETRKALLDFRDKGMVGILLDLRSNPGGLLSECVKVASMFLPDKNKEIVSTVGKDGSKLPERRVGQQLCAVPVVVLTNKGSASASEILSGALKDYKRATLVGETTFGKALVQTVLRMSDGSAMAVTTAHYLTPSGYNLNKKGIVPDVYVKIDKDTKRLDATDNQAGIALRVLREEIAHPEMIPMIPADLVEASKAAAKEAAEAAAKEEADEAKE